MRKLVLKMSVSSGGFACGPHHEIDSIFPTMSSLVLDWIKKSLWETDLHIMGSRTFQGMASWWGTSL